MRVWLVAVVLVLTGAVAACGDEDPDPTASSSTDAAATPEPGAAAEATTTTRASQGTATTEAEPTTEATSTTEGGAAQPLVAERRPMSDAEYDRIDDDGEGGVLDCPDSGGAEWEHGGDGEPGRRPEDALRDAIRDLNRDLARDGADLLPSTGWIALQEDPGAIRYLLTDGDDWRALVQVGGDPATGVWQHNSALLCP